MTHHGRLELLHRDLHLPATWADAGDPLGAGGVGFLPLYMMREHDLIEKHAQAAGLQELSVRWIYLHMTEETARHAGHIDILRELVDGVTGFR